MKQTGIIRRIDNLGRIVIPKEIRKVLHIYDGEMIEMVVEDNNIILKKYSTIKENTHILNKFINTFSSYIKSDIIITDLDKVVSSSNKKYISRQINKKFLDYVRDSREYILNIDEKIIDCDSCFYGLILPIISSYEIVGLLVLLSPEKELNSNDINYFRLLCNVINKYLDE